ncbi:DUF396-domain-containing protein [Punctularia strigosozonata HHB-11173 SS5]|uniref:DUF396-domain-containing protein n=1 Tax=Punctularia strigosozonata (strain HHB-11173) TaxID=741275 RepID=UPI00044167B3|nr:DUF396-domain-containing protein [Punctularia strigosozonata HHB-11173 SS5]EIN10861.1 DUF396-domain-containing protein [Punctularia strigosozonata HHB-11173 SS5]
MSLLHSLSYAAAILAFCFVVLSLASGLLWVSELIEEHTRTAKTVGKRGIYIIILLHVLLYVSDSLPLPQTLFSVACHVVYLQNFSSTWPLISLSSPSFLASCVLVVADHFLWFFYFARITQDARHRRHGRTSVGSKSVPGFADIATFFGICVWLAPLFLFLSLSANDNALPTQSGGAAPSSPSTPVHTRPRGSLFKSLLKLRPSGSDGIIAPHSPMPTTPTRSSSFSSLNIHALNNQPSSPILRSTSPHAYGGRTSIDDVGDSRFMLSPPPRRGSSPGPPSSMAGVTTPTPRRTNVGLGLRRLPSSANTATVDGLVSR